MTTKANNSKILIEDVDSPAPQIVVKQPRQQAELKVSFAQWNSMSEVMLRMAQIKQNGSRLFTNSTPVRKITLNGQADPEQA